MSRFSNYIKNNIKDISIYITMLMVVIILPAILLVKFSQPITVYMDGYEVSNSELVQGDILDFMVLARRYAANHEYNIDNFNCVNYSTELAKMASTLGFNVEQIKGCPGNNDSCHRFLRLSVDFEPQDARFTDYTKKYPIQEVIK